MAENQPNAYQPFGFVCVSALSAQSPRMILIR